MKPLSISTAHSGNSIGGGRTYLEDRKCNFDVEIGGDMLLDYAEKGIKAFVLWSGDSDFADPLRQLIDDGMKVYVFATARRVAAEFEELVMRGLPPSKRSLYASPSVLCSGVTFPLSSVRGCA